MSVLFDIRDMGFAYPARPVIEDLCLAIEPGRFYGILGPNGCGKTTLLDLLAGHRVPDAGAIDYMGLPLNKYRKKALAREIALVPQTAPMNFPFTCAEVVMMGRYPYIPRFSHPAVRDRDKVKVVMEQTALAALGRRQITQLSGGERQRVIFARALAQETPVLLLDEATANMDMQHAIALLNLAAQRVNQGTTVIAVLQDINLAAMFCHHLIFMRHGKVVVSGPTETVLTAQTLQEVFGVQSLVRYDDFAGTRQVVFRK